MRSAAFGGGWFQMQDLSGFVPFGAEAVGPSAVGGLRRSIGRRVVVPDELNFSNFFDASGQVICWSDVIISNNDAGRRVLTFGMGESIVLPCPVAPEGCGALCPGPHLAGFAAGTRILAEQGEVPVERLRAGDRVVTMDHGLRRVIWTGARMLERESLEVAPHHRPVAIRAGAAGNRGEVLVAPGQAVLLRDCGRLIAAQELVQAGDAGMRVARGKRQVRYHQILLERHGIVFAEGMAAGTLYPAPGAVGPEILTALPMLGPVLAGLVEAEAIYGPPARPFGRAGAPRGGLIGVA